MTLTDQAALIVGIGCFIIALWIGVRLAVYVRQVRKNR